jgi:hypothetical protein
LFYQTEKKEYKINESIDYLEVKDLILPLEKKVYPQFDGKSQMI